MKDIKLIIFDLDGTLVNAYQAITSSFNYTMKKLNYPQQSPEVIRRVVGWGDEALLKPFVIRKDLKKAVLFYRKHHRKALISGSRLMPKAKMVLSGLKNKGYLLAIASNRPTQFSLILLRRLKIDKYFDYVLCADKLKRAKPYPDILRKIIRELSVKPRETIYVGDMAVDARAGRSARIKTVIVTTGSRITADLKKERPFRIIPGLSLDSLGL